MAFLLRMLVFGVIAAAAHDDVKWASSRANLPCVVPSGSERVQLRRPPPPLDNDKPKQKQFVWRRDGVELNSNDIRVSVNGTLALRRREGNLFDGVYQCAVHHHGGIILGYPVHLKTAFLDRKFSSHPGNVSASAGQPTRLACHVDSSPPADVTWKRNGESLPDDNRFYQLNNQLLILDVRKEDSGLYRCIASNPIANKSRVSHAGRLAVEEEQRGEQPSFLVEGSARQDVSARRGSGVGLPCVLRGWPRPQVIWQFTPVGGRLSELESTDQLLVLPKMENDLEGTYVCTVNGNSNLTREWRVSISEPVTITTPPTSRVAHRASTHRFNCTAAGRPAPEVTWYKDGQLISLQGRTNIKNSTDFKHLQLLISGVTSKDEGVYQCFASNPSGVASAWATLEVPGAGPAVPSPPRCWPTGDHTVLVQWDPPKKEEVVAYTVDVQEHNEKAVTGVPVQTTSKLIELGKPLTPYDFHIRAYTLRERRVDVKSTVASDLSQSVTCQGQGVPITLSKLEDDRLLVSWKQFADLNPEVVEWIVQWRRDNTSLEHNVTLTAGEYNYTVNDGGWVRVLGTLARPWLRQELALVPWSAAAGAEPERGHGSLPVPRDVRVVSSDAWSVTVRWSCDEAELHAYIVCAQHAVTGNQTCKESTSSKNMETIKGLSPGSEYWVRVRSVGAGPGAGAGAGPGAGEGEGQNWGDNSEPVIFNTAPADNFNLTGEYINATSMKVSWQGPAQMYTLLHSSQLKLPLDKWATERVTGNSVVINDVDWTEMRYVMINDTRLNRVLNVMPSKLAKPGLQYEYTSSGVKIEWSGSGRRSVKYTFNLSQPLELWPVVNVTGDTHVTLKEQPGSYIYVYVSDGAKTFQLSVPPRTEDSSYFYIGLGIGCGVLIIAVMVLAAIFIWRRRKRARSPVRSRRRNLEQEGSETDGAEMKGVGGRLANGGPSRDAGEPLLNGHVHITENPTSKPPNGVKTHRQYNIFDVSRQNTTLESVLDDSTAFSLLDASRPPDSLSLTDLPTNNSFHKLPDDNMNSQHTTFDLNNTSIQPTLEPNG